MKCSYCGASNEADAVFCEECGRSFGRECPSCGTSCSPSAKFCRKCRTPLSSDAFAKTSERDASLLHPEAPRREDPHVAQRARGRAQAGHRALRRREGLDGSRRAGRPRRVAQDHGSLLRDPRRRRAPLRGHGQPVHRRRHHGAVRRADRARGSRAARVLRGAAPHATSSAATRTSCASTRGLSFSVRMGLNSGEVVVGKIGDDLRMDYTAQGHTVGLAARMEQLAEPGRDLSDRAHGEARLRATSRSAISADSRSRGCSEPLHVFELEGVGPLRTPPRRLPGARLLALRRPAEEMAALEAALDAGARGQRAGRRCGRRGGHGKEPALLRVRRALPRARHPRSTRRTVSPTARPFRFCRVLELLPRPSSASPRATATHAARRQDRRPDAAARRDAHEMRSAPVRFSRRAAIPTGRLPPHGSRGAAGPALRRPCDISCRRAAHASRCLSSSRTPTGSTRAATSSWRRWSKPPREPGPWCS